MSMNCLRGDIVIFRLQFGVKMSSVSDLSAKGFSFISKVQIRDYLAADSG